MIRSSAVRPSVSGSARKGVPLLTGAKDQQHQTLNEKPANSVARLRRRIGKHLPYLRRYARAFTGSQRLGDDLIRGWLASLQEPQFMTHGAAAAVQFFRLLHRYADTVEISSDEIAQRASETESGVAEHAVALPSLDRRALLLVYQEEFTPQQAAEILNIDEAEVRQLNADAWPTLQRQPGTSVLIIEDNPLIALDVAGTVKDLNHRVFGIVSSVSQAIQMATAIPPGLVLADIDLERGSAGIVAVEKILKSIDAPVVVITEFPEQLLSGKTLEPAFIVTKPFDARTLQVAISQAMYFVRPASTSIGVLRNSADGLARSKALA